MDWNYVLSEWRECVKTRTFWFTAVTCAVIGFYIGGGIS